MCELNLELIKKELYESLNKGYENIIQTLEKIYREYEPEFETDEGVFGKIQFSETEFILFPSYYLEAALFENEMEYRPYIFWCTNSAIFEQRLFYATSPLYKILNNIGENLDSLQYVNLWNSQNYLLVNPREDVVDWALANREKLKFYIRDWGTFESFIKEKQANIDLQEKILSTLKGSENGNLL